MLKKYALYLFIITIPTIYSFSKEKNTSDKFLNLNFFEIEDGKPTHWTFVYNGCDVRYSKEHIEVKDTLGLENKFGMALNQIPIDLIKGKTVKIATVVHCLDFNKNIKAGLWYGINNPNGPTNTTEWTKGIKITSPIPEQLFIEVKVDSTAQTFHWGVMAEGKGSVGFGYFSVSIDGVKYNDLQSQELSKEEARWLKNNICPLTTTDPNTTDNKDLLAIANMINNAKVVALGEVTHGAKELFDMKHRIIRYLAQSKGYNVFSMEENLPECFVINRDYLINREGSAKDLIKRYMIWPWQTKEVEGMLEWMRDYKDKGGNIQFTGFDKQINNRIFDFLANSFANDPQYLSKLDSIKTDTNKFIQTAMMNGFKPNINQKNDIIKSIQELSQSIKTEKFENQNFLQTNLKILGQSLDIEKRDNYMADNFLEIINQNPNSKFITWAHNIHIANIEGRMGQYLTDSLQSDYLKVGFVIAEGEYTAWNNNKLETCKVQPAFLGTLDYYLNSIDEPLFVMDLRKVRADNSNESKWIKGRLLERQTGSGFYENEFSAFNINEYDILIFIKKVSASELL